MNQRLHGLLSIMKALTITTLLGLLAFEQSMAQEPHTMTPSEELRQVHKRSLKVTLGSIKETKSEFLTITSVKVRAVEKAQPAAAAKLRFRYRGPTKKTALQSSGDIKRQIGLKMRAKDTCNLLYVMWEVERVITRSDGARDHRSPERIVISLKSNPGEKAHSSCGWDGYDTIAVIEQRDPSNGFASARDNKTHRLQADLVPRGQAGYDLYVYVDETEIWSGRIPYSQLREIDGPAGLRSDNGSFIFKFYTGGH